MSPPLHNRLAEATSPYLQQHADNPVHWQECGRAAFAAARDLDRPILLSVGYSSCHWCHVMAHESFEDPAVAALMNRHFVNVKVDREERPDVDRIYMDAVQMVTGRGGWPMTVFLTPAGEPFFAGTYFPPSDHHGLPAFTRVLEAVSSAWEQRRTEVVAEAESLTARISARIPPAAAGPDAGTLESAYRALAADFDREHGGFGSAPKFPQAPVLEFLLRAAGAGWAPRAGEMLDRTLDAMARGGINDHIGGGFARYSVDAGWIVPHFEKMLYDNALLARLYLQASRVLDRPGFATVARATLDYLLADLALPGGGFASAEDADSEGVEGRFYVFTHDEVVAAIGADTARRAAPALGITLEGNFEGANVLHRPGEEPDAETAAAVEATLEALGTLRQGRIRPGRDDKAVAAWNGLAIRALAEAGAVLDEPRYLEAAIAAARFVLYTMRRPDGRLLRVARDGRAAIPAFCEDYAAVGLGLVALYRATGNAGWFTEARDLADAMIELFPDPDGGFFAAGTDAEQLITRPKNLLDNATPSDNALGAELLQAMAAYTGEPGYRDHLAGVFRAAGRILERAPAAAGHLLGVLVVDLAPPRELAIVGPPDHSGTAALLREAGAHFRPDLFVAVGDGIETGNIPLLEGRSPVDGLPAAYLCRDFTCEAPTTDPADLRARIDAAAD
jgi:uncharacterized protein YyaL (SSP411 family)